jgi:hypothetical protein
MILDKFAEIKEAGQRYGLPAGALRRVNNRMNHPREIVFSPVRIGVITDPNKLVDLVASAESCLSVTFAGVSVLPRFKRLLEDPGAIYLSVEGEDQIGYIRYYAAVDFNGNELVFEDVLRTKKPNGLITESWSAPQTKAVSVLALGVFGLARTSFITTSKDDEKGSYLIVDKLGQRYFKSALGREFYSRVSTGDSVKFEQKFTRIEGF